MSSTIVKVAVHEPLEEISNYKLVSHTRVRSPPLVAVRSDEQFRHLYPTIPQPGADQLSREAAQPEHSKNRKFFHLPRRLPTAERAKTPQLWVITTMELYPPVVGSLWGRKTNTRISTIRRKNRPRSALACATHTEPDLLTPKASWWIPSSSVLDLCRMNVTLAKSTNSRGFIGYHVGQKETFVLVIVPFVLTRSQL